MQHKIYEINSTDDIELGIKRESKLEFKVVFDDKKPAKAIFVFIVACGMDAVNGSYPAHIAEFVAQNYSAAVLLVNYHCIQNRHQMGATHYLDELDLAILTQTCEALGIVLPDGLLPKANEDMSFIMLNSLMNYINTAVQWLKDKQKVKSNASFILTQSIRPTKNEYQNFGVMQALDILNAICFVKKQAEFKLEKDCKTLLFGTSHGGYLALLCAKFAPWLIDAVVENSAYVSASPFYVGFGKELDYAKYHDTYEVFYNLKIKSYTKSFWTSDKNSPHFFSPARNRIRNVLDEKHLQTAASHFKPKIISYHGIDDIATAPVSQKQAFHGILQALGFDNALHIATQEDIDGKFIKHTGHGMDMSLKTLIQKELPPLLNMNFTHERGEKREIIYESEDLEYKFKEKDRGGGVELFIRSLKQT